MSGNSLEWLNISSFSFLGASCQAALLNKLRFFGGATLVVVVSVMMIAAAAWAGQSDVVSDRDVE